MAAPQITLYTGDVPNRATNTPSEFSDNADDTMSYLLPLADEYNTVSEFVNSAAESVDGSANYVGKWEDLTGAYSLGVSVLHNDFTWLLLVDLANIALSEPTDLNTDWKKLASFAQQQQNTSDIAQNADGVGDINARLSMENRVKMLQNFNVPDPSGDDLISSTPTTRAVGQFVSLDVEVTTEATNLKRVNNTVSSDDNVGVLRARWLIDGSGVASSSQYIGVYQNDGTQLEAGVDSGITKSSDATYIYCSIDLSVVNEFDFFFILPKQGKTYPISDSLAKSMAYNYYMSQRKIVDVLSDRTDNVNVLNDTPCDIEVFANSVGSSGNIQMLPYIDDVVLYRESSDSEAASSYRSISLTVPSGSTYRIDVSNGAFENFKELRYDN